MLCEGMMSALWGVMSVLCEGVMSVLCEGVMSAL